MAIVINNTGQVKSSADQLSANSVKLNSVSESLEYILSEVKEYWEQSQQDAQTFSTGLQENIDKLSTIVSCNKEFSSAITNYMDVTEKISSTTVN